jgi:hypothetical protein
VETLHIILEGKAKLAGLADWFSCIAPCVVGWQACVSTMMYFRAAAMIFGT